MGSSPKKSSYLNQIEAKTRLLIKYQSDLAHYKAWLPRTSTKDACRRDIERTKGEIARIKSEISMLKMQLKNAPKG